MEHVRDFSGLGRNDAGIAGGKGASLGEMTRAGIPVPPGFVVLSGAFEKFLKENGISNQIDSILNSVNTKDVGAVESASKKIQSIIINSNIPKDVELEIKNNFETLSSKFVAVRSSATAEDSTSAAWAGQLDTFLNTTEKNLLENVKKCWASLFTPRAIFYRFEKGMHKQKISVAVVVQKMVESEVSGISFSVHPVTQNEDHVIIEAGLGLGESIVSGQITPDSHVVEKSTKKIVEKNIAEQEKGLFRADGGGSEWIDIPKERGFSQKLDDEEVVKLADLVVKIEKHYGFPVDVEWAREKGKFYIVQSRPITTLTPAS